MSSVTAMQLVECEARCGVRVRPGVRYCTRCEGMAVELEGRRLAAEQRRRQQAPPDLCEASDCAAILVRLPVRERVLIAAMVIGSGAVALGVGTLLWMGARHAVAILLRWSATP